MYSINKWMRYFLQKKGLCSEIIDIILYDYVYHKLPPYAEDLKKLFKYFEKTSKEIDDYNINIIKTYQIDTKNMIEYNKNPYLYKRYFLCYIEPIINKAHTLYDEIYNMHKIITHPYESQRYYMEEYEIIDNMLTSILLDNGVNETKIDELTINQKMKLYMKL